MTEKMGLIFEVLFWPARTVMEGHHGKKNIRGSVVRQLYKCIYGCI